MNNTPVMNKGQKQVGWVSNFKIIHKVLAKGLKSFYLSEISSSPSKHANLTGKEGLPSQKPDTRESSKDMQLQKITTSDAFSHTEYARFGL